MQENLRPRIRHCRYVFGVSRCIVCPPVRAVSLPRQAWEETAFTTVNHREQPGVFILGGLEEILMVLEDNQVTLQTMMGSRFIMGVKDEVSSEKNKRDASKSATVSSAGKIPRCRGVRENTTTHRHPCKIPKTPTRHDVSRNFGSQKCV